LSALGAAAAATLALPRSSAAALAQPRALASSAARSNAWFEPRHLAWVWQFRHDGDPGHIRDTLAQYGLGVVLKTHDGTNWMSRYDSTPNAIKGAGTVEFFADFFEQGGVPFHAWAVVRGTDPAREAQLASDVLNAGARSLFLDLEPHSGFWVGTRDSANRLGEELRRRRPNARLSTSIDPRPWQMDRIPLAEFAAFSDEISPQVYWQMFGNSSNARQYSAIGAPVSPGNITGGFVLSAAMPRLRAFGRPIHPIGDGTVASHSAWASFVDDSFGLNADAISVWRFGVADPLVWQLLSERPPQNGTATYVVQPGDTLGGIAAYHGTTSAALAERNGITNPNLIAVGAELTVPRAGSAAAMWPPAPVARTHVVQRGETVLGLAFRYGTSASAILNANGLMNPNLIRIGQRLIIP
jgi:LysM repeat protein